MAVRRRTLLGAALGFGAIAGRSRPVRAASVLNFIPQSDLTGLDPIWSTQTAVRNHGYMVFDTLFSTDANLRIQLQMAEGLRTEDDGRRVEITLRPGLRFHDGAPVLARDCVASVRRWSSRDPLGRRLMTATEEISAPDDCTVRFRLRHPFPSLAYALGKLSTPLPFIMPDRPRRSALSRPPGDASDRSRRSQPKAEA